MAEVLHIVGAGGHAKVVIDAYRCTYPNLKIVILDDDPRLAGTRILGEVVQLTSDVDIESIMKNFHYAIGHNRARKQCYELSIYKYNMSHNYANTRNIQSESFTTIIHPQAIISRSAVIGEGCFIAAGAVIGPFTVIGKGCIINHNAVVDHDCVLEDWVHIAPNATLSGGVMIGELTLIGANATLLPGLSIAREVTVGAGAVVTRNVDRNQMVVGVPARKFNNAE